MEGDIKSADSIPASQIRRKTVAIHPTHGVESQIVIGDEMGIATKTLKGLKDKFMAKYGEKIVANLADTSADAPNNFSKPMRDVYDKLAEDGALGDKKADR